MKKNIRLVDIAEKAGVSRVAVGKVLLGSGSDRVKVSEETAKRIREIAGDLGYHPNRAAQQLRGKPSNLIGVVTYLHAPSIELDRLAFLEREAHERGYQVTVRMLANPEDPDEMMTCLLGFEAQGVDGLIFLTGERCACSKDALERFKVCLYSGCPEVLGDLPGMISELEEGIQISTRHLLDTGRRRIGMIGVGNNPYDNLRHRVMSEMIDAVPDGDFFVWTPDHPTGKMRKLVHEIADKIVETFVIPNELDAVLAINDYWAGATIKALNRAGVAVPEQVAVIGYSNLELSEFTEPGLTTIEEHNAEIARVCFDLFFERMNGRSPMQRSVMPTLVKRGST